MVKLLSHKLSQRWKVFSFLYYLPKYIILLSQVYYITCISIIYSFFPYKTKKSNQSCELIALSLIVL